MRLSELIDQVVGSGDLRPQEPPRSIRRPLPRLNPAVADMVGPAPRVDLSRGSNTPDLSGIPRYHRTEPSPIPSTPFLDQAVPAVLDAFRTGAQILHPIGTDTLTPTQNTVAMLAAPTGLPQIASGIGHLRNAASYPFESVDPRIEQELGSAFGDLALGGLGVVGMFGMMPGGRAAEGLPRVRAAAAPEAVAPPRPEADLNVQYRDARDFSHGPFQALYYETPERVNLLETYVDPAARGQGAGRAGLDRFIQHVGANRPIYLTPAPTEAGISQQGLDRFYARAGFEPVEGDTFALRRSPTPPRPEPRLPGRASDGSVLPVRPREPFRNSLRGGSDDLRDAARRKPPPGPRGPGIPMRPGTPIGQGALEEQMWRAHNPPPPPPQGITAYHGSPHDFDRFDAGNIGTGQGAQSYGHGHYVAENESVARSYRDQLAGQDKGRMYQVRINSTPENFLDLDSPVSAQPPHIRSLLERGLARPRQVAPDTYDIGGLRFEREGQRFRMYRNGKRTGETFASIDEAHQRYGDHPDRMMAGDALNALEPDQVKQAELLRNAGAHGVRYLDQGSRQAGQGTRNYVVMRDDILNITRKYGLPLGLFGGQAALSRRKAASS